MLLRWNLARSAILSASAFLLLGVGGCGNGVSLSPSDDVARAALQSALQSWREGGKPGTLAGTDPAVQVLDTPWSQGERLESYEVLGKEAGPAEKRFSVRLSFAKPERTEEVEYYVLGQSPVMVFRDEDYQRNINMENGPSTTGGGQRKGRRSAQ